jgi:hypothetical protein
MTLWMLEVSLAVFFGIIVPVIAGFKNWRRLTAAFLVCLLGGYFLCKQLYRQGKNEGKAELAIMLEIALGISPDNQ